MKLSPKNDIQALAPLFRELSRSSPTTREQRSRPCRRENCFRRKMTASELHMPWRGSVCAFGSSLKELNPGLRERRIPRRLENYKSTILCNFFSQQYFLVQDQVFAIMVTNASKELMFWKFGGTLTFMSLNTYSFKRATSYLFFLIILLRGYFNRQGKCVCIFIWQRMASNLPVRRMMGCV